MSPLREGIRLRRPVSQAHQAHLQAHAQGQVRPLPPDLRQRPAAQRDSVTR